MSYEAKVLSIVTIWRIARGLTNWRIARGLTIWRIARGLTISRIEVQPSTREHAKSYA